MLQHGGVGRIWVRSIGRSVEIRRSGSGITIEARTGGPGATRSPGSGSGASALP